MGLFSSIKRQLLKVIEWSDTTNNTIVYKYPMTDRDEIMNGCQLVVRESQVAMLVSGGQIADVYGPGTHKLTTANMPIITKLASWKYGFDSPFKADVFYVNTKQFIDLKWGTPSPIMMRDADFGPIRIRARGSYSFKVDDAPTFMREIFGTNKQYTTDSLKEYFKSMIVEGIADALGEAKIPALDIAAKYRELSDILKDTLKDDFGKMGIKIVNMVIEAITLPEEVEKTLDQRTSVGIMSDKMGSFAQYQAAQAIRDAAQNEGGGLAGMGVGMGAGVGLGSMFANSMANAKDAPITTPTDQPAPTPVASAKCSKCGNSLSPNAKFCPECGEKVEEVKFCPECGEKILPNAKFCGNCGKKLN